MCGILGCCTNQDPVDESKLRIAASLLRHRGPDDQGFFINNASTVGLAHLRLSILDLSSYGHQPMCNKDESVVLVFNGEIYNYKSLRKYLASKGICFSGDSDTAVLLQLYIFLRDTGEGIRCLLEKLNGIFSFAIWDSSRGELLVARDAFGVKPLYIVEEDNRFLFSSEIKALIPLMDCNDTIDVSSIDRYLTYLWCPGDGTPFSGVRKLNPGTVLRVRNGKVHERLNWYQLPIFRPKLCRTKLSKSALISDTAGHLRKAVHRQMVADVPVGAFLSGGLDSSSVVAFAKELNPDIHCFTIEQSGGTDAGVSDDLPYAIKVANSLNVPLEVVTIDSKRIMHDLNSMVFQLDEPLADIASLNVFYISQLARQAGMKVLLSGAGGDDLFTGYRRHRAVLIDSVISRLPQTVRKVIESLTSTIDQRNSLGRRLNKFFHGASLSGDARLVNYFAWNRRSDLLALYTSDFLSLLDDAQASIPMSDFLATVPSAASTIERMLSLEQRFFLADHNLNYTDKMSMAAGVEVRVPFLDLDLVEFAAEIPYRFKQRGAEGKWVLKKAMEPYLPRDIIYRPKSGFGVPIRRWMQFELHDFLGDYLSFDSIKRRGMFNPEAVHQMILDNRSGRIDASYTLLSLLCIEMWCRHFIDGVPDIVK